MQRTTVQPCLYLKKDPDNRHSGIGAPGGKTDEEIAESIVDESDVIWFLVKNDSIQESEFEFLWLIPEAE